MPSTSTSFLQRYYVNNAHFNASDSAAPILLVIGPEFPTDDGRQIRPGAANAWYASQLSALLVVLENRYYGQSVPNITAPFSPDGLRYLTFAQILADLDAFIAFIVTDAASAYPAPALQHPVILMGCSYSAMLAVAYQAAYSSSPHVVGAFASSAPMRIQQMLGNSVAQAVRQFPARCQSLVNQSATSLAAQLVTDTGRASVSRAFNTCSSVQSVDDGKALVRLIVVPLTDLVMLSGWPSLTNSSITVRVTDGCDLLVQASEAHPDDAVAALADFTTSLQAAMWAAGIPSVGPPAPCLPATWDALAARFASFPEYYWLYCRVFPWDMTIERDTPALGPLSPFQGDEVLQQLCSGGGVSPADIAVGRATWLARYGDDALSIRNTLLSSGTSDVWWPATVNVDLPHVRDGQAGDRIVQIEGASHCQDYINPPRPGDSEALQAARATAVTTTRQWIAAAQSTSSGEGGSSDAAAVAGAVVAVLAVLLAAAAAVWWYRNKRHDRGPKPRSEEQSDFFVPLADRRSLEVRADGAEREASSAGYVPLTL